MNERSVNVTIRKTLPFRFGEHDEFTGELPAGYRFEAPRAAALVLCEKGLVRPTSELDRRRLFEER